MNQPDQGAYPHTPEADPRAAAVANTRGVSSSLALSAVVLPTLESAQIYEAVGDLLHVTDTGEYLPVNSRKRRFPRALRRLRDRLQTLESRLQLEVNALRQEIADLNTTSKLLEIKRQVDQTRVAGSGVQAADAVPVAESAVRCVERYAQVFKHGYAAVDDTEEKWVTPQRHTEAAPMESSGDAQRQCLFVESAMHPSIQFGQFANGREMFVARWHEYTAYHGSLSFTHSSLRCIGSPEEPIVVANGTLSGYINANTLQFMFPHALAQAVLAQRLLGSCISYSSRTVFYFDSNGTIIQLEWNLDRLGALLSLLENLRAVESVMPCV